MVMRHSFIIASLSLLIGWSAQAEQFAGDYLVVNQTVPDFVSEVARDADARIQMSPDVRGRLRNHTFSGDVPEILDEVAAERDLDWFKFNGVYFVSSKKEAVTRIIRLGDLPATQANQALVRGGLLKPRFPVTETSGGSALSVTGPPRLVAMIETVVEGLPAARDVQNEQERTTIKVRRALEVETVIFDGARQLSARSVPTQQSK